MPRRQTIDAAEDAARREAIIRALEETDAVRELAAKRLGRSPAWLYRELRRLKLEREVRRIERRAGRRTWAPGRPASRAGSARQTRG